MNTETSTTPVKKAAILIEPYKQDVFEQRLKEAKYTFKSVVSKELIVISVWFQTQHAEHLVNLIKSIQQEIANARNNTH